MLLLLSSTLSSKSSIEVSVSEHCIYVCECECEQIYVSYTHSLAVSLDFSSTCELSNARVLIFFLQRLYWYHWNVKTFFLCVHQTNTVGSSNVSRKKIKNYSNHPSEIPEKICLIALLKTHCFIIKWNFLNLFEIIGKIFGFFLRRGVTWCVFT